MGKIRLKINALKNKVLDVLYPKDIKCIVCGKEIKQKNDKSICEECNSLLPYNNGKVCIKCGVALHSDKHYCVHCKNKHLFYKIARAPFIYDKSVKNLIYKLKYSSDKYLSEYMAKFMCEEILLNNIEFDLVVSVPLHKKRYKKRGYNQSALLGKEIAKKFNVEFDDNSLKRIINTKTQTSLTYEERQKNLNHAFELKDNYNVKGKNILLVDDVFTTGATVEKCSELLFNNGAKNVYVITFAHTDPTI